MAWRSYVTSHYMNHCWTSLIICLMASPGGKGSIKWATGFSDRYWQLQAITRINVDLSSKVFCGIHLKAISQEMLKTYMYILYMSLKITNFGLQPQRPMSYFRYICSEMHLFFADPLPSCSVMEEQDLIVPLVGVAALSQNPVGDEVGTRIKITWLRWTLMSKKYSLTHSLTHSLTAIWPSLSPCTVINPILLNFTLRH